MSLKTHITADALTLFTRNGIKRVSMDDVARKAGVSKRTLYEFFRDKETLLIEVLREISKPFTEHFQLLERMPGTALEIMLLFHERMIERQMLLCSDFLEDLRRYPEALKVLLESKRLFLERIAGLLKRGEQEHVFMSGINYDMLSILAHERIQSPASEAYAGYTRKEVHNTVFFIFLRGICTDTGRDILEKFVLKKRYGHKLSNQWQT
jgi:AcrR family transcriptional regulator